jgi:hypothetical protein
MPSKENFTVRNLDEVELTPAEKQLLEVVKETERKDEFFEDFRNYPETNLAEFGRIGRRSLPLSGYVEDPVLEMRADDIRDNPDWVEAEHLRLSRMTGIEDVTKISYRQG